MGTRNLTIVVKDGEYKVAQYGQSDGYPSGQGATILSFLKNNSNIEALTNNLSRCRYLDPDGKDKDFIEAYKSNVPKLSNEPDNRTPEQIRWFRNYITRDLGGEILNSIANSGDDEIILKNSIGFAGDSLLCEWAYLIDLDDGVFEVYRGFNSDPVKEGRFKTGDEDLEKTEGYEPIKAIKTYPLSELPEVETFVSDLEGDDD